MALPARTLERSLRDVQPSGVRAYRAADEPRVLNVLTRSLRRWQMCPDPVGLWRWKHLANPFGRSHLLVNENAGGEIVGVVALMFWQLRQGRRVLTCGRSTELATDPAHRRTGVATSFHAPARQALNDARVALVFHTPNQHSVHFTRRTSRPLFEVRPRFGVRTLSRLPLALIGRGDRHPSDEYHDPPDAFRGTPTPVSALFERRAPLTELLAHDSARRGMRLHTNRTFEYLRWRYGSHPTIRYYTVALEIRGRLEGCVIYRADRVGGARRLVIQELLLRQPADTIAQALRHDLDAVTDCDLVQYFDSESPWRHLLPSPVLPTPNAYRFTIGLYDQTVGAAPLELENWSLALGDLQEI